MAFNDDTDFGLLLSGANSGSWWPIKRILSPWRLGSLMVSVQLYRMWASGWTIGPTQGIPLRAILELLPAGSLRAALSPVLSVPGGPGDVPGDVTGPQLLLLVCILLVALPLLGTCCTWLVRGVFSILPRPIADLAHKFGLRTGLSSAVGLSSSHEAWTGPRGLATRWNIRGAPPEPGVCGLANLGNTCYLNATVQSLSAIPELTDSFLSGSFRPQQQQRAPRSGTMLSLLPWPGAGRGTTAARHTAEHFASLLQQMWSAEFVSVSPAELLSSFSGHSATAQRFVPGEQQDVTEFLVALLDALHEDMKGGNSDSGNTGGTPVPSPSPFPRSPLALAGAVRSGDSILASPRHTGSAAANSAWDSQVSSGSSLVSTLMTGQSVCRTVCPTPGCGGIARSYEALQYLSLPLPPVSKEYDIRIIGPQVQIAGQRPLLCGLSWSGTAPNAAWPSSFPSVARIRVTLPDPCGAGMVRDAIQQRLMTYITELHLAQAAAASVTSGAAGKGKGKVRGQATGSGTNAADTEAAAARARQALDSVTLVLAEVTAGMLVRDLDDRQSTRSVHEGGIVCYIAPRLSVPGQDSAHAGGQTATAGAGAADQGPASPDDMATQEPGYILLPVMHRQRLWLPDAAPEYVRHPRGRCDTTPFVAGHAEGLARAHKQQEDEASGAATGQANQPAQLPAWARLIPQLEKGGGAQAGALSSTASLGTADGGSQHAGGKGKGKAGKAMGRSAGNGSAPADSSSSSSPVPLSEPAVSPWRHPVRGPDDLYPLPQHWPDYFPSISIQPGSLPLLLRVPQGCTSTELLTVAMEWAQACNGMHGGQAGYSWIGLPVEDEQEDGAGTGTAGAAASTADGYLKDGDGVGIEHDTILPDGSRLSDLRRAAWPVAKPWVAYEPALAWSDFRAEACGVCGKYACVSSGRGCSTLSLPSMGTRVAALSTMLGQSQEATLAVAWLVARLTPIDDNEGGGHGHGATGSGLDDSLLDTVAAALAQEGPLELATQLLELATPLVFPGQSSGYYDHQATVTSTAGVEEWLATLVSSASTSSSAAHTAAGAQSTGSAPILPPALPTPLPGSLIINWYGPEDLPKQHDLLGLTGPWAAYDALTAARTREMPVVKAVLDKRTGSASASATASGSGAGATSATVNEQSVPGDNEGSANAQATASNGKSSSSTAPQTQSTSSSSSTPALPPLSLPDPMTTMPLQVVAGPLSGLQFHPRVVDLDQGLAGLRSTGRTKAQQGKYETSDAGAGAGPCGAGLISPHKGPSTPAFRGAPPTPLVNGLMVPSGSHAGNGAGAAGAHAATTGAGTGLEMLSLGAPAVDAGPGSEAAVSADNNGKQALSPSKGPATLARCLDLYTAESVLEADNAWACPSCKLKVPARQSTAVVRAPPVLIITLKRFVHLNDYGDTDKLDSLVDYPVGWAVDTGLDLAPWMARESTGVSSSGASGGSTASGLGSVHGSGGTTARSRSRGRASPSRTASRGVGRAAGATAKDGAALALGQPDFHYDLFAVVHHSGTLGGGHYIAHTRHPASGVWYSYNDHIARPTIPMHMQEVLLQEEKRQAAARAAGQGASGPASAAGAGSASTDPISLASSPGFTLPAPSQADLASARSALRAALITSATYVLFYGRRA